LGGEGSSWEKDRKKPRGTQVTRKMDVPKKVEGNKMQDSPNLEPAGENKTALKKKAIRHP